MKLYNRNRDSLMSIPNKEEAIVMPYIEGYLTSSGFGTYLSFNKESLEEAKKSLDKLLKDLSDLDNLLSETSKAQMKEALSKSSRLKKLYDSGYNHACAVDGSWKGKVASLSILLENLPDMLIVKGE